MMYNDSEYQSYIRSLSTPVPKEKRNGFSFYRKLVPGQNQPGDIDPWVLSMLHMLNQEPGPETIDLQDLGPLRACMNWKSFDITTALINVKHCTFIGRDGNVIPLRVYSCAEISGIKPCILYFHGGGWIGGQMGYVENICKLLAERIRGVVVSVDYRLAPENPFPAGFNDCYDAVRFVAAHSETFEVNPKHIGVAGDSAGANLAAACALYDRNQKEHHICFQGLAYPCVNPCGAPTDYYIWNEDFYEIRAHKEDILSLCVYELPVQRCMKIVEPAYVQGRYELTNPYISPLFAKDLRGIAPSVFILPEYDYLRQEGEAYASRLAKAGCKVDVMCYCGINHGFMEKVGQYPQAEDAIQEIAKRFLESYIS